MAKLRSHKLDIYGAWLHVATDTKSYRAMRKRLPSLDKDPEAHGAVSITLHTGENGKVTPHLSVWLDLAATEDHADLVNLISHEATHVAVALLDHIGQGYDSDSSEALAYLVGFVSEWLWQTAAPRLDVA